MKVRIHNTQTGNERSFDLESGKAVENYSNFQIPIGEVVVSIQWFTDEIFIQTWGVESYARMLKTAVGRISQLEKPIADLSKIDPNQQELGI